MTRTVITEQMPSSGTQPCQHNWQIVETKSNGDMVLVCRNTNCNASKTVPAPKTESRHERPVLLG